MSAFLLITPLFIVMALGYVLKRSGILEASFDSFLMPRPARGALVQSSFRGHRRTIYDARNTHLPALGGCSRLMRRSSRPQSSLNS